MGKSFNDRNRKKGAERAYRKTRRDDRRTGPNRIREDWNGPERRDTWEKPTDRSGQP